MLSNPFKWKHFVGEIILLNVRWYLKYPLSYRNLKEMMAERGVEVDHSTIMRWCDKKLCQGLRVKPSPIRLGCLYCGMRSWLTGGREAHKTTWRRIEP